LTYKKLCALSAQQQATHKEVMQLKAEIKRGGSSGGDLSDELVKDCKNPIISDMAEYDELQRQLLNTSFRNAIVSNYHYILLKYKIHMVFCDGICTM
jgi:hypothetical protein